MSTLRIAAAALFACLALPVHATFHLWQMTELYTNADGSVQFLELSALATGQQFLGGHSLESRCSDGTTTRLEFNDLGGNTGNKTMLIGTQGFASLGIVFPDFTVPNGFFCRGGGTITFAEGADVWVHGAPPTSGGLSLLRNGQTAANTPRNFAGIQGTVPANTTVTPVATVNVHGLWLKPGEGGWGVNLSQHGTIIFLSWFTYDAAGAGMWLFMSGATLTANNTWTGDMFRATGAPFNNYSSSAFHADVVGSGTLTFTDNNHGTFTYTVNGITQAKQIERFIFGSPVPTCDQSGAVATNFTDLWGLPSEGGWGINVAQQGDLVFLSWFTYGAGGLGQWFYGSGLTRTSGNTFTGQLFQTTGSPFNAFDATRVQSTPVGDATLTFTSPSEGTFRYTVGSTTQTKNVSRNIHALPATTCR